MYPLWVRGTTVIKFNVQSSSKFRGNLSRMYRGFLYTLPPTLAPLVSPAFVTIDKPILILYYLLKSMVYIKAQAWCYTVMGFAKCIMSCICHYSITHNFTILNIPYIQSIHSFLPTSPNHWSFTFSIVLTATLL